MTGMRVVGNDERQPADTTPAPPTFSPWGPNAVSCDSCGALAPDTVRHRDLHIAWHARLFATEDLGASAARALVGLGEILSK